MRVIVFVKATVASEERTDITPELKQSMQEMEKFNDELRKAGLLVMAEGLKPSSAGKRVAFFEKDRKVSDGPFPHPSELVAGFWIWNVKDMDQAVEWVKRCPNPMSGPSEIEIRPFDDMNE